MSDKIKINKMRNGFDLFMFIFYDAQIRNKQYGSVFGK